MRPVPRSLPLALSSFVAVLVGSIALVLGTATPAGAHAVVVSSSPTADERLSVAPTEVTIVFSEEVSSELGGISVLDSNGTRVDNDDSSQPTPTSVRTTVQPNLPDDTYVANYKVVSADGHPISGSIVFGVGDARLGDVTGLITSGDPATELLGQIGRFVTYTAALLVAGLTFFLVFLHDGASDRRRMASIVRIATIFAAAGSILAIAVQASLATGDGLGAIARPEVFGAVLREGLGWSAGVLLIGLALCHIAVGTRPSLLGQALTVYGGLAVTTSFVFWGHAIETPNPWLSVPADIIHVAVAAVWFGGIVGLALTLRARIRAATRAGRPEPTLLVPSPAPRSLSAAVLDLPEADDEGVGDRPEPGSLLATVAVVRRFSTAAAISVVILTASGVALGWQDVGSLSALTSTPYGQTLLVKLGFVAVVLVLAGYNRFLLLPWLLAVPQADDPSDPAGPTTPAGGGAAEPTTTEPPAGASTVDVDQAQIDEGLVAGWRTLRRTVVAEALLIVAVLAVTAVLVNLVPARTGNPPAGPFTESKPFRDGQVSVTVTPNQQGVNSIHADFIGPDGNPADMAQKVGLELLLPDKVGPLEREMVKGGVGHFFLEGISDLSIAGTWEITLNIRVSDFGQERVTFIDTIG